MLLVVLGLAAGALTTVAGLGGGMLLLLVLSLLTDARTALALTAPALLLGNLHRLYLYRTRLDRRVAVAFAAGAVPGSLAGGLLTVGLPTWLLHGLMLGMTAAAVLRALGLGAAWRPGASVVGPAGLGIGAVAATSGGAGLLTAPLLLATGLTGEAYIATSSACAASMHLGRLSGYSAGGLVTGALLGQAAILGSAILAGNLIGDRLRGLVRPHASIIEHVTLVACVTLAIAGAL
jgi:uncharacterized protein